MFNTTFNGQGGEQFLNVCFHTISIQRCRINTFLFLSTHYPHSVPWPIIFPGRSFLLVMLCFSGRITTQTYLSEESWTHVCIGIMMTTIIIWAIASFFSLKQTWNIQSLQAFMTLTQPCMCAPLYSYCCPFPFPDGQCTWEWQQRLCPKGTRASCMWTFPTPSLYMTSTFQVGESFQTLRWNHLSKNIASSHPSHWLCHRRGTRHWMFHICSLSVISWQTHHVRYGGTCLSSFISKIKIY